MDVLRKSSEHRVEAEGVEDDTAPPAASAAADILDAMQRQGQPNLLNVPNSPSHNDDDVLKNQIEKVKRARETNRTRVKIAPGKKTGFAARLFATPQELVEGQKQGNLVRSETIMPKEISAFLQEYFPIGPALDAISKALAREILNDDEEQKKANASPRKVYAKDAAYNFATFDENNHKTGTQVAKLPFDVWVTRTHTGAKLELIGKFLAEGASKRVYDSKTMHIDLTSPEHNKAMEETVLAQGKSLKAQGNMLKGAQKMREHFTDAELQSMRLAGMYPNVERKNKDGLFEVSEARLEGGSFDKPKQAIDAAQTFQIVSDVAKTLALMHGKGLAHGDIKPSNIFLSKDLRGHVGDLDGVSEEGKLKGGYTRLFMGPFNWGAIGGKFGPGDINNFASQTKFSDIHALAVSSAMTLFGSDFGPFASWGKPRASIDSAQFRRLANESIQNFISETKSQKIDGESPGAAPLTAKVAALNQAKEAIAQVFDENNTIMQSEVGNELLRNFQKAYLEDRVDEGARKFVDLALPAYSSFLAKMEGAQKNFADPSSSDFANPTTSKIKLIDAAFQNAAAQDEPRAWLKLLLDHPALSESQLSTYDEATLKTLNSQIEAIRKKYDRSTLNPWRGFAAEETLEQKLASASFKVSAALFKKNSRVPR